LWIGCVGNDEQPQAAAHADCARVSGKRRMNSYVVASLRCCVPAGAGKINGLAIFFAALKVSGLI